MSIPVVLSWSGGKDASMALAALQDDPRLDVVRLLTTINTTYRRIVMHGVREEILDLQAAAIGLPLDKVWLSETPSNEEYEMQMAAAMQDYRAQGIRHVAFGDIFLEDLKEYRNARLAEAGMEGVYPLWKRDTEELAGSFIARGFRARLCCVDGEKLPERFAGREFDRALLDDLPDDVDPCGENGEFHTCVSAGPIFREPLALATGERVTRMERFHYCDLLPQ